MRTSILVLLSILVSGCSFALPEDPIYRGGQDPPIPKDSTYSEPGRAQAWLKGDDSPARYISWSAGSTYSRKGRGDEAAGRAVVATRCASVDTHSTKAWAYGARAPIRPELLT